MFLNKVVLIGRLTRDPELKYTATGGIAVTTFTLAVGKSFLNSQGERETDFIPIVTWRKQAELCANYLNKGSLVAVDGRIQVRTYDDKEGKRHWVTEVVADVIRFLDKKEKQSGPSPSPSKNSAEQPSGFKGQEIEISEEDVPF